MPQPEPEPAALLVVTGESASLPQQQTIPPQPDTPPAEAVTPRAPASPATNGYPAHADGFGIKLGGYNVSRWAEDWRLMRAAQKRDDPLDRLKYLPLAGDGAAYLTLSGEMRLRENYLSRPGLAPGDDRREQLLRIFAGADFHAGPLRLYGELAHGGLSGDNYGTPATKYRNALYAQQYFAELSGPVGNARLGVRHGRQEFTDGAPGLISAKDDNTLHTEMNGSRAWAVFGRWRVDLFDFRQTIMGLGGLSDDRIDHGTRFSGATFGTVLAQRPGRTLFLDPFFWSERNDSLKWGKASGRELRHYYGARLWGSLDRLTIDWLVNRQDGNYRGRPIDAWFVQVAQTYSLSAKGVKPKPGIHFDYGSGGGAYDASGAIRDTRTITAGSIAYSYQLALNLTNLFQVSPNFTLSPAKSVDLTVELQHSLRVDDRDAVYRGAGTAYAGTQLVKGAHVGDAARLQATWKVSPRVSVIGRYEYFEPGSVLKATGARGSHFLAGWISLRF